MPSGKACVSEIKNLQNKGAECKGLKVNLDLLIKIRECFERANICNQSRSLHGNIRLWWK